MTAVVPEEQQAVRGSGTSAYDFAVSFDFLERFVDGRLKRAEAEAGHALSCSEVQQLIIMPDTLLGKCRYAQLPDIQPGSVAEPTIFVSHKWSQTFRDMFEQIKEERSGRQANWRDGTNSCCGIKTWSGRIVERFEGDDEFYWVDLFALNQHGGDTSNLELLDRLPAALFKAKWIFICVDSNFEIFQSMWCMYEWCLSIEQRGGVDGNSVTCGGLCFCCSCFCCCNGCGLFSFSRTLMLYVGRLVGTNHPNDIKLLWPSTVAMPEMEAMAQAPMFGKCVMTPELSDIMYTFDIDKVQKSEFIDDEVFAAMKHRIQETGPDAINRLIRGRIFTTFNSKDFAFYTKGYTTED